MTMFVNVVLGTTSTWTLLYHRVSTADMLHHLYFPLLAVSNNCMNFVAQQNEVGAQTEFYYQNYTNGTYECQYDYRKYYIKFI